jgi:hypothetical protein
VLSDLLVLLTAAFFGAMAIYALVRPADVLSRFGVAVATSDGRNEVRAVYGGFGLAVAAMLVYAAVAGGRSALWIPSVVAISLAGMALGRLISLALESERGSKVVWQFLLVEVVLAALLFASHALL